MALVLGLGLVVGQTPPQGEPAKCSPVFVKAPTQGTKSIELKTCSGDTVTLNKRPDDADSPNVWLGDLLQATGKIYEAGALFVFFDHGTRGLVYLNAEMYRVTPTGSLGVVQPFSLPGEMKVLRRSVHLEKIDPRNFPNTHLAPEKGGVTEESAVPAASPATAEMVYIDLLLIYSQAAQKSAEDSGGYGGYESHAELVEAATNWTFKNHGLGIRVRVHAKKASLTDEKPEKYQDKLSAWLNANSLSLQQVPGIDVLGWIGVSQEPCGLTSCGGGKCLEPGCKDNLGPHFSVKFRCAVGKLSVAHELGHILGANHHPLENKYEGTLTFPYAQATCSERCDHTWATVMGNIHKTSKKPCEPKSTILPLWSAPGRCFLGEPLGITGQQDNIRVITENARKLAEENLKCVQQTLFPQDNEPSNTEPWRRSSRQIVPSSYRRCSSSIRSAASSKLATRAKASAESEVDPRAIRPPEGRLL